MTENRAAENKELKSVWALAKNVGDKRSAAAREAYLERRDHLREMHGIDPTPHDVMWKLMKEWVSEVPDAFSKSLAYYHMADFLHATNQDWSEMKTRWRQEKLRHHQQELQRIARSSVTKVEILAGQGACDACSRLNGQTISVKKARKGSPLPCGKCTTWGDTGVGGWCRCTYVAVFD